MTDTIDEDEPHVRPFADFLAELRKGSVHSEASQALHDLIAAVRETRKAGTFTLTIKASVQPKTSAIVIEDRVTTKAPALERDSSLWFVDDDGNLSRRDPTQLELPGTSGIRAVPDDRKAKRA